MANAGKLRKITRRIIRKVKTKRIKKKAEGKNVW
jgi:hypothetical protein